MKKRSKKSKNPGTKKKTVSTKRKKKKNVSIKKSPSKKAGKQKPKQRGRKVAKRKKQSMAMVPAGRGHADLIFMGKKKRRHGARMRGFSPRKMLSKSNLMENMVLFASVAAGSMGSNFISTITPGKQPIFKALSPILAGLVITMLAGKNRMIATVGAGIGAGGILKTMKQLFPTIPYLSGEVSTELQITPADVQKALSDGTINNAEAAALLESMQGYVEDEAGNRSLGASMIAGGMGASMIAGEEGDFLTTED
jgi:hypothetical protein